MKYFRKLLLSVLILLLSHQFSMAQTPYYDALSLKNLIVGGKWPQSAKNSVAKILANYCRVDEIEQVFFTENPFIRNFAVTIIDHSGLMGGKNIVTPFNSIGGLDVTKYANAIADLMIERAKQELTIAFFDRFKKFAEDNKEFQILFPKTTDNLSNLLTYKYPQMLPALRKGFFEDLEKITYNLDDVLELPRYRYLLKNFPQVSLAIRSIRLIHELETKNSTAADVIKKFAAFKEWDSAGNAAFKNMGSTIKFASIFSEGLRNKDSTKIWVSNEDIQDLIIDEDFTNIYIGLIYQQVKNEKINFYLNPEDLTVTEELADMIARQKDNILLFQNKISEFINLSDKVMESYKEIRKKKSEQVKITNDDIFNYINVSIDIMDYAFSIIKIINEKLVTDKYLTIVKKSNALYKEINSNQYTQAVSDAIDILTEVYELTKGNKKVPTIARVGDELDKIPALNTLITFIEKVKPYALFMANMVEAKDEKEIKAALENVILPVGSSSIKKNSLGNVSVQTYLGAYLSASNGTTSSGSSWSDKFGVAAPIGISWTPSFFSWKKAGSLSLFGSLFDLGAIVDYKLKKDSASGPLSKDYKIKLGQIFSPGVYAVYGFAWNLPLAFGFGVQYGPGLSKIEKAGNTVIGNPSVRWNLFLAVDMPFFNLVNKPKHN